MKPFKTYNGGKEANGTYQNIINYIPKCDLLVEAFAGNCAISRHIQRPAVTVINDIDRSVYDKLIQLQKPGIIVKNNCYKEIINEYDKLFNVFFYLDPPYLFSTRKSGKKLYNYEFSDNDHIEFLTLANTVKNNCMISHYPCELYDSYLSHWVKYDYESLTRQGLRTERIYMNYNTPEFLQDYRFIGKDYIERQQIKRKIKRNLNKIDSMSILERNYLISILFEKYGEAHIGKNNYVSGI